MKEIQEYLIDGLAKKVYETERNLLIWEQIGQYSERLKQQNEETQDLFKYVQLSAQTSFVLSTCQIFDKPKNYPTRCIHALLGLIREKSKNIVEVSNLAGTIRLMKDLNYPEFFYEAIKENDPSSFPLKLCGYYDNELKADKLKGKINEVKIVRDKIIAHNENVSGTIMIELQTIRDLLKFAKEIIYVLSKAYFNTSYKSTNMCTINENAKSDSFFIEYALQNLPVISTPNKSSSGTEEK